MRISTIERLGIADQVLLWRVTDDARSISAKIKEKYGVILSFQSVAAWLKKNDQPKAIVSLARADVVQAVTREILEGELGRLLFEAQQNYARAKADNDERALQGWWAAELKLVEIVYGRFPPIQDVTRTIDEAAAEVRAMKLILDSLPPELRRQVEAWASTQEP